MSHYLTVDDSIGPAEREVLAVVAEAMSERPIVALVELLADASAAQRHTVREVARLLLKTTNTADSVAASRAERLADMATERLADLDAPELPSDDADPQS